MAISGKDMQWRLLDARSGNKNAKGEYYLTDIVGIARITEGLHVVSLEVDGRQCSWASTRGLNWRRAEAAVPEAHPQAT